MDQTYLLRIVVPRINNIVQGNSYIILNTPIKYIDIKIVLEVTSIEYLKRLIINLP